MTWTALARALLARSAPPRRRTIVVENHAALAELLIADGAQVRLQPLHLSDALAA